MKSSTKLRALMADGPVIVPGAWDAMSARIVEKTGGAALYVTGYGVSGSLGFTDTGYMTQTELMEQARRMSDAVTIPMVLDIDDGFGNPLNVQRTIKLAQQIENVAAVHIEDMEMPHRCPYMGPSTVISAEKMVDKIKAAVDSKTDPDFTIIARIEYGQSFDEVLRRACLYAEAGADMIYPIRQTSREAMERLSNEVPVPLMDTPVGDPDNLRMSFDDYKKLNYRIVTFSMDGFALAYSALKKFNDGIKDIDHSKPIPWGPTVPLSHELEAVLGMGEVDGLLKRYFPDRFGS